MFGGRIEGQRSAGSYQFFFLIRADPPPSSGGFDWGSPDTWDDAGAGTTCAIVSGWEGEVGRGVVWRAVGKGDSAGLLREMAAGVIAEDHTATEAEW